MIRKLLGSVSLLASVMLAGCDLGIENPTNPPTETVLSSPDDAESLIGSYYKRWSSGVYGSTTNMEGMANVMSLMNYSSLANNCQNNHLPFANASNSNLPGNVCLGEQARLYQFMGEVNRVASDFLQKMESGDLNLSPTSATPDIDGRNVRAKAMAEFLRGLSLGYVALMYDSAAVISPGLATTAEECVADPITKVCRGRLKPYTEVAESAYVAFERALDYTNMTGLSGSEGFPIPTEWLPSPMEWDEDNFSALIHSYRARIRANMARTPEERAAANWDAIIADVEAGLQEDHYINTSTTVGPGNSWRQQYASFTTWHQMPPFFIGMADQSGSYAAWIAQPLGDRGAGNQNFMMVTQDLRFPQGATRTAQQGDQTLTGCRQAFTACKRYFYNRAAADDQFSGVGWGWSQYDIVRFYSWDQRGEDGNRRNGPTLFMTEAEMDLIRAEGYYRKGTNDALVATLVNETRTAGMGTHPYLNSQGGSVALGGGLPAVTAAMRNTTVPGTNGATGTCIPKVPGRDPSAPGDFSKVGCGDLWEALKYEKRLETAYTHYVPWFLDGRGWGDLPMGTPLYWAVPYQDLQARGKPMSALYGTGPAPGNPADSYTKTLSVYGW